MHATVKKIKIGDKGGKSARTFGRSGRLILTKQVLNEHNCMQQWHDSPANSCGEITFVITMTVKLIAGKTVWRLGCKFTQPWNIGPSGRIPQRSARPSIKLVWTCTVFGYIMCLFIHGQVVFEQRVLLRAILCAVERSVLCLATSVLLTRQGSRADSQTIRHIAQICFSEREDQLCCSRFTNSCGFTIQRESLIFFELWL